MNMHQTDFPIRWITTSCYVATWRRAALEAPSTLYRLALPHNFSPRFVEANPRIIEQGEERLGNCPPDFFHGLVGLIDAFQRLDVTERLERIACPTLVMVGDHDALKPPRYSRLIADRIPDSRLLEIPGSGHAVILERPDENSDGSVREDDLVSD